MSIRVTILTLLFIVFVPIPPLSTVTASSDPANDMILIPAGSFIMGTGPEAGKAGEDYGVDEEPRHTVQLKAFYINRYEITVGEYKKYLKATGEKWVGDPDLAQPYSPDTYFNPEERDRYPIDYISWYNAHDYCQWKGERLPSEEEWEKAARGTDGRKYSWGNDYDSQKANSENAGFGEPTPVGSFHEDKSPFGLYDVSGNLLEWTSSHYLPYKGNTLKDNRWTTNAYVLKGGSFLLPGKLFARPAYRSIAYPAYAHRMHGFRCAKDAGK